MHEKAWVFEGVLAATAALVLTYFVVEPGAVWSRYGAPLGWSALIVILALLIQSYWKTRTYPSELRGAKATVRYEFVINKWGGLHVALSIALLTLVAVHGAVFFDSLYEPSIVIWLGAAAFPVLIILNFSGVLTEVKRRSRKFGPLKTIHLLLVLFALALTLVHIEGLTSGPFQRSIIVGTIVGLVGVLAVFVTVPLTVRISG
jgi:hypothetical protein